MELWKDSISLPSSPDRILRVTYVPELALFLPRVLLGIG